MFTSLEWSVSHAQVAGLGRGAFYMAVLARPLVGVAMDSDPNNDDSRDCSLIL